ncbi:MAG: RepB family plasmid replication initiator protein [Candidatus Poribacteria bacterium]|nr:RepB family plasmid replication initiator protein [Candidatus Poribacteria bacterium]
MHLAEINEVIKASPAIQIESKITHLQRRAWNVLLANAYNELPNRDIHRVSVAELAKKLGFNSRDYDHLKETLEALVDCTVKWNILGKDKKEEWGVASLLAEGRIRDGICTYAYPPYLRTRLYNPRIYTKLNLSLQNQFTSRYALVLWEICFDYFDLSRNEGETPFIPIETFRELMGLEKGEYSLFKVLNRDVIKPAIKEVNALTNFLIEAESKRIGRRIGELKFKISRLKERPSLEPTQMPLFSDMEDLPIIAIKLIQAGVSRKEALRIAEQEWEVVDAAALSENKEDFAVYVEEKIGLARYATSVKNVGGFIVKAIQENYQNPEFQKQLQAEKAEEKQAMLASMKDELLEKQNALIRQAVRANPELLEQAAAKITSGFVRERLMAYDSIKDAYDAGGVVAGDINNILSKDICSDLIAPVIAMYEAEIKQLEG